MKDMIQKDKELIIEFCKNNLHTHTDWTGTRVETKCKCNSVDDFVDKLYAYLEDNDWKC